MILKVLDQSDTISDRKAFLIKPMYPKNIKKVEKKIFPFFLKNWALGINQWNIFANGAINTTVMEEVMEKF